MELTTQQQTIDYLSRSAKILIALPAHLTVDRLCSAYALYLVLQKLGKEPIIASSAQAIPRLDFLPSLPAIQAGPSVSNALVIRVDTANAPLEELSYNTEPAEVQIFLKPKQGQFSLSDVQVEAGSAAHDLIITLGAQTLEDLGELYQAHSDTFFNTPKLNIDTAAGNEYYGTINHIEVTASGLSEVVAQILVALPDAEVEESAATALLAGIVANTHSFQDPATTPATLTAASTLIARGARQQDVVKYLYKTKDFALLKLWGRALARIKTIPEPSLLYSLLTRQDFEKTGLGMEHAASVLRELLENVTGFQTVALMAEQPDGVRLLLAGMPHVNLQDLVRIFAEQPPVPNAFVGLYQMVSVDLAGATLADVEQKLIDAVKV
jgi:nanoRNase/pAp phosphatase (c-di-AMP/oligoRNAs hydrolase)